MKDSILRNIIFNNMKILWFPVQLPAEAIEQFAGTTPIIPN